MVPVGKQRLLQLNKVVYFPRRLHISFEGIAEGILAFGQRHTRGNPNAEILQGVDNPNKLLIYKGKDQLDIPQFGNLATIEFHRIQDSVWEANFEGHC